jgi:hypothetical protein
VVGIPQDIPDDEQMRVTEAVVPFADSELRTINTPIFIEGAKKCSRAWRRMSASTAMRCWRQRIQCRGNRQDACGGDRGVKHEIRSIVIASEVIFFPSPL